MSARSNGQDALVDTEGLPLLEQRDHDFVAVGDVTLRLRHRLISGALRSKAATMLGERRVPPGAVFLSLNDLTDEASRHGAADGQA